MPRRFPHSLWFFLAPALALLADQLKLLANQSGLLFALLAFLSFWIGLLLITFSALRGKINRLWLLPVVALLVAYYATSLWQRRELAHLQQENAAFNALVRQSFDPDRQALVIAPWLGEDLVDKYNLPAFWSRNKGGYYWLRDREHCGDFSWSWSRGVRQAGGAIRPEVAEAISAGCILPPPQTPDLPTIEVEWKGPTWDVPEDWRLREDRWLIRQGDREEAITTRSIGDWQPLSLCPNFWGLYLVWFGTGSAGVDCVNMPDLRKGKTHLWPETTDALAGVLGLEKADKSLVDPKN